MNRITHLEIVMIYHLVWGVLAQHDWEDSLLEPSLQVAMILAAIDKNVVLTTVSMKVAVDNDLSFFY